MTPSQRWNALIELQNYYIDFRDFYTDCSEILLGFTPSEMQYDIALYMWKSPLYAMVQAQRSEAKTTIAGCFAVWCMIHNPTFRVVILSAGSDMATEVALWCIQIITNLPRLDILVPDKSHVGTRTSVEAYDIHHDLKGVNKSPSIKCMGVTSNLQGTRADLLIPDDRHQCRL